MSLIPTMNIGVVGHVDHGKTTLVQALTGQWTARHSEELKKSMTIKLGYANGYISYCRDMEPPEAYGTGVVCPNGEKAEILKSVSYIDAPGHEILMATMLAGSVLMDAALLVIAANEPCPQPQTQEHLAALEIIGLNQLIVVQNKVDTVDKEQAKRNYKQIVDFITTTRFSKAPIIPVSALHKVNIDVLALAMYKLFKEPERVLGKPGLMLIARSFDVNPPGTPPERLVGGVVGGGVIRGEISLGDEIEIKPGIRIEEKGGKIRYEPLVTRVVSIKYGDIAVDRARPGGLVAIGTTLDPSLTKADRMRGNVLGHNVPDPVNSLVIEYRLFEKIMGVKGYEKIESIKPREPIIITIGTMVALGIVTKVTSDILEVAMREPVVIYQNRATVAISRNIKGRWRLAGWGYVKA